MRSSKRYSPAVLILLMILGLALAGCAANGYSQFFTSTVPASTAAEAANTMIPHVGDPDIYAGGDPKEDDLRMAEDGYMLVGYSSFNGPAADPASAKIKGRQLHAAVVLVYSKYATTVTGVTSYVLPRFGGDTQTSTTSGTIYGGGGSVNYSERTTTTVPPQQTVHSIPYSVNRYDQTATFWVKAKPLRLGVRLRDLTSDERAARGSNKGVAVDVVVKGSPAFLADVLRGDILMKIGDVEIAQEADVMAALDRLAGSQVDLVVVRGAAEKTIRVRLNPKPQ